MTNSNSKNKSVNGLLFQEVSKRKEKKQGNDVPINRKHKFADTHIKSSSRDNMETSVTELQGQHGRVQLKSLRNKTPWSPRRASHVSHFCIEIRREVVWEIVERRVVYINVERRGEERWCGVYGYVVSMFLVVSHIVCSSMTICTLGYMYMYSF